MDIWIDNRYFEVKNNYTIYQYCAKIGINLPCFCYHERLSIAGNCRICVVEVNNAMAVSCATLLLNNMKIFTKSKRIKKSRESVLEFLLVNHPLDCPICDQGGECDLQDILITYGSDRGRFYELNKRSVTNLNCCGPFIKTVMTRCIHCTRCVRFVNEISSIYDFGIIGRGANMEIGTYILNFINDELLGNIIDLCPVGALISMPSSFIGRNWELKYIQSIDILDSICSTIRLGLSNNSILRILPHLDESYDEWITNKARFIYDSFNIQRLYYPKLKLNFKFIIISWKLSLFIYNYLLFNKSNDFIQAYCGPFISLNCSFYLKNFFNSIGCFNLFYFENIKNSPDFRFSFLLNNTLKNLNNLYDVLIIGCNLRLESPILNSVFRKNYLNNSKYKAFSIGLSLDFSNFPIINIGSSMTHLYKLLLGISLVNKYFLFDDYYNLNFFLKKNLFSLNIILGSSCLIRNDFYSILKSIWFFFDLNKINTNNINILSRHLGRISLNELNLYYNISFLNKNILKKFNFFNFLIGIDSLNFNIKKKNYINVFLGFFFISNFFEYINLVLPSTIYVESVMGFLNLEGRFRFTNKVITSFKLVFSDFLIIESLSILLKFLYLRNFTIIKNYNNFIKIFYNFYNFFINYLFNFNNFIKLLKLNKNVYYLNFNRIFLFNKLKFNNTIFSKIIYNYYNNDIFCKKSKIMTIMSKKININNFKDNY